jgi:hypothetical protein
LQTDALQRIEWVAHISLHSFSAESSGQSNPAVAQVSMKLKQAMSVAATKPSRAVGALWTLSQGRARVHEIYVLV